MLVEIQKTLREELGVFPLVFSKATSLSVLSFQLHLLPILGPITFLPDAFHLAPCFSSLLLELYNLITKILGVTVFWNSD